MPGRHCNGVTEVPLVATSGEYQGGIIVKVINSQTVLNVVESEEIEGLFFVEADGFQVTVLTSKDDAEHMHDVFSQGANPRLVQTYTYNPSADLNNRVRFFAQVPVKDQVVVIAYLENGEYSDIFQYQSSDYHIDIQDMNRCAKTAMAGVMYCMTVHNNWISKPIRKQA